MDEQEKKLIESWERIQFLEKKIQTLKREIQANQAEITAIETRHTEWHWTMSKSDESHDN
jgi:prefoldin subunit 5